MKLIGIPTITSLCVLVLLAPRLFAANEVDVSAAGNLISQQQATEMTQDFTRTYGGVRSHLYAARLVRKILEQKGVAGVRLWHGQKEDGSPAWVLAGVDDQNRDMLYGPLVDDACECPPFCPGRLAPPLSWANAGREISLQEAERLTRDFSRSAGGVRSYLLAARRVAALLDQPDAEGLRIYYGKPIEKGDPAADFQPDAREQVDSPATRLRPVLVAVDFGGFDLEGQYLDDSLECPPYCP